MLVDVWCGMDDIVRSRGQAQESKLWVNFIGHLSKIEVTAKSVRSLKAEHHSMYGDLSRLRSFA